MIGVFDSGLGGLTVVKELLNNLPEYQIIYFGDTARLPYGTKQASLIQQWSKDNSEWLIKNGAELIIIACHTASSWAFDLLKRELEVPVFDVLTPGLKEALATSQNRKIGVIGTPGMIESNIYYKRLEESKQTAFLHMQACPLFVPIIEEGWMNRPGTKEIAREYLIPLREKGIDTLIMGCTHYPLLGDIISEIMGPKIKIVDPANALASDVRDFLQKNSVFRKSEQEHKFYFSAKPYHLELISRLCLNKNINGQVIHNDK